MAKPVRIGVDASALLARRTGVGNYLANILTALPDVAGPLELMLFSNVPIDTTGIGKVTTRIARPEGWRGFLWQNSQLSAQLLADPPDLYWGTSGLMPLVRPRRMATIVTVHDLVYHFAGETLPPVNRVSRRLLQPTSVRTATRVIAVSQATADDVQRIYGRTVDAVIHPVVNQRYGPVAADEIARVRAQHDLPGRYLLTLGTLEPRKNLIRLVEAVMLLQARGVAAPLLAIAGGSGWCDDALTAAIDAAEAAGVARRLGFVDDADLPGLYAGADYFILASTYEGFGMPVVEAQLCGTRVLAADIAALREASDGFATFFEPTTAGIADCLANVIADDIDGPRRQMTLDDNDPYRSAARVWDVMQSCL